MGPGDFIGVVDPNVQAGAAVALIVTVTVSFET